MFIGARTLLTRLILMTGTVFCTQLSAAGENAETVPPAGFYALLALCALLLITTAVSISILLKWKKEREALEQSAMLLKDVLNAIPVRVFWKDKNSVYMGCNKLFAEDTGRGDPDKVVGFIDNDFGFTEEEAELYRNDDREVMDSGEEKINYEEPQTVAEGVQNWINTSKTPLRNNKGEIYGVLGTYEDITPRKRIEENLKISEEKLRSINANIPGVLFELRNNNGKWKMNYVSDKAKDFLAIPPDSKNFLENFIDKIHNEDRQHFLDSLENAYKEKIDWHFEGRYLKSEKETVYFRVSSTPADLESAEIYHGLILDITETRLIKEQLHHSQKMKAVGHLAGGVAHDFNNMLGAISMSAEILGKHLKDIPEAKPFQKIIIDSAGHASELTQQLLTFSRKQPASKKILDLHDLIDDLLTIIENTVDKKIDVKVSLDALEAMISGDASYLQNAFLNLAINSSHAMPKGGTIDISTRVTELDEIYCENSSFELSAGMYIALDFTDDGEGIDSDIIDHIFEPFFTTKDQGKGTGLGLAAVYGTIEEHKGAISVYSEIGSGTVFHILLPLANEEPADNSEHENDLKGTGNILVIDDEEGMRLTAAAMLEEFGYEVDTAVNGREGLEKFTEDPHKYNLVLLDMIMPEMNGRDCMIELRKIKEDIKIVLATGFTKEGELEDVKKAGLDGYLAKPYSRTALGRTVSKALK